MINMETFQAYYRIDRREICFFHAVFESYEGLATVTTIDRELGLIRMSVSPGAENDVARIIRDLRSGGILIEETKAVWKESVKG